MQLTSRTHRSAPLDRHVATDSLLACVEEGQASKISTTTNPHRRMLSSSSTPSGRRTSPTSIDFSKAFQRQWNKKSTTDPRVFLQRLIHGFSPLSIRSKCALLVAFMLAQIILLSLWDQLFYQVGMLEPATTTRIEGQRRPISNESSFAVAINTYRRPEMLKDAVMHYADTCGRSVGVAQVFVIWAEQNAQHIPDSNTFFGDEHDGTILQNRAAVHVLEKAKDSLNSRFEPIPQLLSTAVFMVDDDLRVDCSSLRRAFDAWKTRPDSMVGYYPRLASPPRGVTGATSSSSDEIIYHTWPVVFWKQTFNLVLTKASFLHSKYLELYTDDNHFPKAIKDHVDKNMNCEDIAMSMLVANYTKYQTGGIPAPPMYVEGRVSDKGLIGGISSGSGHMTTRSECLTILSSILKAQGWPSPLDYQVPLRSNSWIRHAPGFWWQYRPSNTFEWLALANTFT